MAGIDKTLVGTNITVRPAGEGCFDPGVKSIVAKTIDKVDGEDWALDNIRVVIRDAKGNIVLVDGSSPFTTAPAKLILGESSSESIGKYDDETRLKLIAAGLPVWCDEDVYVVDGSGSECRPTHAVIQSGFGFDDEDPFISGLCSGKLADALKFVEVGRPAEDGTVAWRNIFLTTVPIEYPEA